MTENNEWRHAVYIKDGTYITFPFDDDYDISQIKITFDTGKTWRSATPEEIKKYLPNIEFKE